MRILVTNDDGIDSPGLHALAERAADLGEVTVFAPSGDHSGAGAAIGQLSKGLPDVHAVDRPEMPSATAIYHLDGPPALASMLVCAGILDTVPDLVLSGINPGANIGYAVHYSGTIGACITASVYGVPSVAVSLQTGETSPRQKEWDAAARAGVDQVPRALEERSLLNVNVPNVAYDQFKGVRETELSERMPWRLHSPTLTAVAPKSFSARFERRPDEVRVGTDLHAVTEGYVSVTALTPTHAAD